MINNKTKLNSNAERLLCAKNVVQLLLVDCEGVLAVLVCSTLAYELKSLEILESNVH